MEKDFDLEKFVKLFDTAMTSNNPTVRTAFKNLMIVATLVESDTAGNQVGPLKRMLDSINELKLRVEKLENSKTIYPYPSPGYTITTNNPYITNGTSSNYTDTITFPTMATTNE